MGKDQYGIGVVGLGMGHTCCQWVRDSPGVRLVAVCDSDPEQLKRSCEQHKCEGTESFDGLIDRADVDIVYIVTPSGTHSALGVQAAEKGKHVIIAKPMDVTLDACDRLIERCDRAGVLCAVDFNNRFVDAQQQIHHAIDRGRFGKLILGEARLKWYRSDEYYRQGAWRGTWEMDGGGSLANQTIHQIDQLLWHMGPAEAVVAAQVGIFNHPNIDTEDLGMAMLRFKNGAVGSILGTTTFSKNQYSGLEIHGTEGGVIEMDGETTWVSRDEGDADQVPRASEIRTTAQDVAAVLNGEKKTLLCDGHEGRKSLELLTAIYRSARERREIALPF